ncbi:MAG: septal ring lytic transglycosylase RlpA family protein [Terriglobia bacterium]
MALISLPSLYASIRCPSAPKPRADPAHPVKKVQYGKASWYGSKSEGRLTACGTPFNEHQLIAAHRTLPLGSKVKVTNLRNGRSVIVRIMDRGPWIRGRIIDLSQAAARRLGFRHRGVAPVKVRVLSVPRRAKGRSVAAASRPPK